MDTALAEIRPLSDGDVTRWKALLADATGVVPDADALAAARRSFAELAGGGTSE
ncbi:hypothetical protein [Nonomuraea turkmeniaca]|uniref:hypothetical protein n=1 Tax=Nonomuraea turkmeniaca TaxID=103838 RepID=UPI001476FF0F|nr:hypothetical protein [Nonomuraea turkmeniaca]